MFNISKTPVLIVSTPRTGSSALGSYLCDITGPDMVFFNEPDFSIETHMPVFEKYYETSNRFLLKVHAYNLKFYRKDIIDYLTTSNDVYRISISRRDIVEQIASYYIAIKRNKKFHYYDEEELKNYTETLPIDIGSINHCIQQIREANSVLKNCPLEFNEHVFHEDIPELKVRDTSWWREREEMGNHEFFRTPKPTNYKEICMVIKMLM